jgi:hypothetical protein
MRWMLLLLTLPATSDLGMIDQLNECVQLRFQTLQAGPDGLTLGMSRIMRPPSFGRHFVPKFVSQRDFEPEGARETEVLARLEEESMQVGFYLFGRAILDGSSPNLLNPRVLKGPGAMTKDTPRAARYPGALTPTAPADALPDWRAIYPLAERAMRSFADGGHGFETTVDSWRIAARPVLAAQEKCRSCHGEVPLHQAIGGVLYAYRRAGK